MDEQPIALAHEVADALILWNRHKQLVTELAASQGDELAALRAIRRYLSETVPSHESIMPIMRLVHRLYDEKMKAAGRKSNASKPAESFAPMAWLAASVTALHSRKQMSIDDALSQISRAANVDRRELKSFRKNVVSEVLAEDTVAGYKLCLREIEGMTETEFDGEILRCSELAGKYLK
ncbi:MULTISPECIES: hypothetical protein [unclassified Mesorhizobium]|uniref:hypothetical protein n=1 Tax=unclassified Mesorhizobium TaxID=325217 RepID=UPI000FD9D6FB|nr:MULTISPECIES: hypothetical protein [unclassified Mesorhizobium]TGQ09011.1 hypothetical protein EN862_022530 [Mesorhizobium sp. M2E.F.Ca.ET.219.01.1.1]TGT69546.1 hypothetical protein EN809_024810 [Mesorhizobium sp. M2E.F.Ca.ET.166.01.1.1]TGW01877.1 hypothetical protein EN797_016300 [Mesorhizobium sp. M2E.F.Ca.ET.154.01.1.1]